MTTNQEWLFSLTLEEYLKWMESEHSEPKDDASGYGADFNIVEPNFGNFKAVEMDASRFEAVEMDASRFVVSEPDSREKLEADVRKHYAYSTTTLMYPPSANKTTDMLHALPVDTVIGWLDRQAAITKRETLHDNPTCSGRNTCTANRPTSESADHETAETSEISASKDEIRDVDVWNVAYEIYCAGGYVDNGNEPNPPTDGIRKLLDRQAAITREEADAGCNECFTEARKREHALGEAIDGLADQVELERRKAIELTNAINELQKKQPYCCNQEQPLDSLNTMGRYIDELTDERDELRKKLGECSAMLYKMFTENMKHEPCKDYEPKDDASGYGSSESPSVMAVNEIAEEVAKRLSENWKDVPANPSGFGMKLTDEEIEGAVEAVKR